MGTFYEYMYNPYGNRMGIIIAIYGHDLDLIMSNFNNIRLELIAI